MAEPLIRPASFAQKRLWFLDQLDPGSSAYNLPRALRIAGSFNIEVLQKALRAIVARHESLRTTFVAFDGDPVQLVHPAGARVEIPLVNLETVAEDKREMRRIVWRSNALTSPPVPCCGLKSCVYLITTTC